MSDIKKEVESSNKKEFADDTIVKSVLIPEGVANWLEDLSSKYNVLIKDLRRLYLDKIQKYCSAFQKKPVFWLKILSNIEQELREGCK